jgi:hypothetical protein
LSILDDNLDNEDDDTPEAPQKRQPTEAEIRMWRRDAKKYAEAEPELTRLQRENLLLRSDDLKGLSPVQAKALWATHEGDPTPEALRATAQELGFVEAPKPDVPEAEVAAHQRMQQAAEGADPSKPDPLAGVMAAQTEEDFWAQARAAGVTSDT